LRAPVICDVAGPLRLHVVRRDAQLR
jgi:hypothetical protein